MKIKVISLLTILLLICSCQKNNSLERTKLEGTDNINIQSRNLYGKWKLQNTSIFDKNVLIHSYTKTGDVSFEENYLTICIENECSKLNYNVENNNIKVENDGSLPSEDISVVLKEQDIPLLSLSYSINSLKYTYIYELEN